MFLLPSICAPAVATRERGRDFYVLDVVRVAEPNSFFRWEVVAAKTHHLLSEVQ